MGGQQCGDRSLFSEKKKKKKKKKKGERRG